MKVGDKFKKPYPFKSVTYSENTIYGLSVECAWVGGCDRGCEYGPEISDEWYEENIIYLCDGEGFIEYEVLAMVEMPRKYQNRIIYRVTMVNPDGGEKKSVKAHTVTEAKFNKWIKSAHSSYHHDYEVR